MSTAVFPKRRETPGLWALPILAYCAEDAIAAGYFKGVQCFRCMHFEDISREPPEVERIILVSKEDLVEQHYNQMWILNTRVLALINLRFKDSRNDGAIYAYLPPNVP